LSQLINQGVSPSTLAALTQGAPLPSFARAPIPGFGGLSSGTPVAGSPQAQIMGGIQDILTPQPFSTAPPLPPIGLSSPYSTVAGAPLGPYSTMAAAPFGGLSAPYGLYPPQYGMSPGAGKGAGGGWTGPPVKLPWWGAPGAAALSASKMV
jgi:hypothetical protein